MDYVFSAERKLVFTVRIGGRNLLVEFGDRNSGGRSSFVTSDAKIAHAIRRTSLSRRGVIIETSPVQEPAPTTPPVSSVPTKSPSQPAAEVKADGQTNEGKKVRDYDNFTLAREAIVKEFGIKKSDVRNPTALARFAKEKGFTIRYSNAA